MRAELVPPIPYGFITCVQATFLKKIFYVPQGNWKSHIKHNCKLDDLRAGFEIAEGYRIGHGLEANFLSTVGQGGLF